MKSLPLKLYQSIISLEPKCLYLKEFIVLMQIRVKNGRKMGFLGVFTKEKG